MPLMLNVCNIYKHLKGVWEYQKIYKRNNQLEPQ